MVKKWQMDPIPLISAIYVYQLMSNVKLLDSKIFDYQMQMHTGIPKDDVSISKEFQQHLSKEHRKILSLVRENAKNIQ